MTKTDIGRSGAEAGNDVGRRSGGARGAKLTAVVAAMGSSLAACSLVANLSDFDGARLAVDSGAKAKDSGAMTEPSVDSSATSDDASIGDETTVDDEASVDMDAGVDSGRAADTGATVVDSGPVDSGPPVVVNAGGCDPMWPEGGVNLLTNPDFEDGGATGWTAFDNGVAGTSSSSPYCGKASGELTSRVAFFNALATNVTTTAGTYTVSAWVMQDGMTVQGMALGGICGQTDGGTNYPAGPNAQIPPYTWTFMSGAITVPDGCATLQFFVGQPTSAIAPFPNLYADDVYFGQ